MWGIPWAVVERMLIDAPKYEGSDTADDKPKSKPLRGETLSEFKEKYGNLIK